MSLKSFVENVEVNVDTLPLIHNCDTYTFKKILVEKTLKVIKCKVFNENLLYTYYGKPSFRLNHDDSFSDICFFPTCLIFKNITINPSRVYPFDSGSFERIPEMKNKYFHPDMEIQNFDLSSIKHVGEKIVSRFYSSNKNYYLDKPVIKDNCVPSTEFQVQAYIRLITNKDHSFIDDRGSSIEYIFNQDIKLSSQNLKGIILPNTFLEDSEISNIIKNELKIEFVKSYYIGRGNPKEYHGLIFNYLLDFLNLYK